MTAFVPEKEIASCVCPSYETPRAERSEEEKSECLPGAGLGTIEL